MSISKTGQGEDTKGDCFSLFYPVLSRTFKLKKKWMTSASVQLPKGHYQCKAFRIAAGLPKGYDCPNLRQFKPHFASAIFVNYFKL